MMFRRAVHILFLLWMTALVCVKSEDNVVRMNQGIETEANQHAGDTRNNVTEQPHGHKQFQEYKAAGKECNDSKGISNSTETNKKEDKAHGAKSVNATMCGNGTGPTQRLEVTFSTSLILNGEFYYFDYLYFSNPHIILQPVKCLAL